MINDIQHLSPSIIHRSETPSTGTLTHTNKTIFQSAKNGEISEIYFLCIREGFPFSCFFLYFYFSLSMRISHSINYSLIVCAEDSIDLLPFSLTLITISHRHSVNTIDKIGKKLSKISKKKNRMQSENKQKFLLLKH